MEADDPRPVAERVAAAVTAAKASIAPSACCPCHPSSRINLVQVQMTWNNLCFIPPRQWMKVWGGLLKVRGIFEGCSGACYSQSRCALGFFCSYTVGSAPARAGFWGFCRGLGRFWMFIWKVWAGFHARLWGEFWAGWGFGRLLSAKVLNMVRVRGRRLQEVAESFRVRFCSRLYIGSGMFWTRLRNRNCF